MSLSSFNMMKGLDVDDPCTDLCLELPTFENKSNKSSGVRPYHRSKMPRLRWSYELHRCFKHAVQRCGGQHQATPKMVRKIMDVKGLTIAHIKSHLQMYRNMKHEDTEEGDADGTKSNTMDGLYQMTYVPGSFLYHYYNYIGKSVFNGHPNSTVTTNYLGQIASSPTTFPPAPWKYMPEKKMMGWEGQSNYPSGNMFKDFFNGSTTIQAGNGNKMVGAYGSILSTKSASSMIEKKDFHGTKFLELFPSSDVSLELTLG